MEYCKRMVEARPVLSARAFVGEADAECGLSRADSLASIDRFKKIAANIKATVIIQHDARDVGILPAFPAAAK